MFPEKLQEDIETAVDVLKKGGVVAFPTDTLYGLGANSLDVNAVERIFQIKGRSRDMGLPLLLGDVHDLEKVATEIPDLAWILAEKFWPGALTLVLKKSKLVPDIVTGGKDTVAVRVPYHVIPMSLARGLGAPITGTSANKSGMPGVVSAQGVREQLGDAVDFIVDGGLCPGGKESTILDLTSETPRVLRKGALQLGPIQMVCPVPLKIASELEEVKA